MDEKSRIQRRINELKESIYVAKLDQKRLENDYIKNGSEYLFDYRRRLMQQISSLEAYILRLQTRIENLQEELKNDYRKGRNKNGR